MRYDAFDEMNKIFDQLFTQVIKSNSVARVPIGTIKETDTGYSLKVELPGVAKENIDLQIMEDSIVIREKKESSKKFYRKISLPEPVQTDLTTAVFRDGLLEVHLPKVKPRVKHVDIE
jgi:HSP20 family protein